MFVAKFQQVQSDKFKSDKNGQKPFIGEVLAGTSHGSIINGTMFQRDGLLPNKLYACENYKEEGFDGVQTRIISEVSVIEFMSLRTALGAPVNDYGSAEVVAEATADSAAE